MRFVRTEVLDALAEAGIRTFGDVKGLSDEELQLVEGVTPDVISKLRKAAEAAAEGEEPPAPPQDAAPNTEEREMGGNPANPDVNVVSDTSQEGLKVDHEEPATTIDETASSSAANDAHSALQIYENQLAVIQRDNAQLRERDAATTAKMRELYAILETPDGLNVEERVKGWKAETDRLQARVGQLQIALGIGPDDDAERAAGALKSRNRLADVDPTSDLPAYGHLLLMTALARVSPLLTSYYNTAPTEVKTGDGDTWSSRIEETLDEEGEPLRLVVIRHEPGAYAFQEARARMAQLESNLAAAVRDDAAARKRLDVSKASTDATVRDRAKEFQANARKRGAEIQAEIEKVRPLTEEPEAREWRFNADLDGYALKGPA